MSWFHGGYWALWYAVFTAVFCYFLPSHDAPWMLALACFVFIPCMLLGCYGGVVRRLVSVETNAAAAAALERKLVSPGFIFAAGVLTGVLALLGVVGVWAVALPYRTSQYSALFVLFASPLVALAVPFLGVWFLRRRCTPAPPPADEQLPVP